MLPGQELRQVSRLKLFQAFSVAADLCRTRGGPEKSPVTDLNIRFNNRFHILFQSLLPITGFSNRFKDRIQETIPKPDPEKRFRLLILICDFKSVFLNTSGLATFDPRSF